MSHAEDQPRPVPLAHVALDDAFWGPVYTRLRTVTLQDVFGKFERDGAFANFARVAAGLRGEHRGFPWFDGLVFETIRAAADFLATSYDAQLDARLDGYIAQIAAAQAADPDGYLNTYVTLMGPETRWGANGGNQLWSHEEYNAGCLIEAAAHHFRATGKTTLLALAVRFANYLCEYIGPPPRHNIVPSHSLPEEAVLKLYRLLRDTPELAAQMGVEQPAIYLDLVRFWVEGRGNHAGRVGFTEYAQDHRPVREQDAAVGHAVRATLFYTGLTALANETGAEDYRAAAARLWDDVTARKMYLTGGVGSINQYEGFSFGYYLPSDGYNETCAAVGLAFWAGQMHAAFADAAYPDVVERVLYNGALAGVSLGGTTYTYQNPLVNHGELHRWEWHSCPCCPPMLLKLYAALGEQIYAHTRRDIFVQQYIGSTARIALETGEIALALESALPWQGHATITLELAASQTFALRMRVPGWCPALTIRVNGEAHTPPIAQGYAVIERAWHNGDRVELEFAMPVLRLAAHPSVNQLLGHVALQRGPLVYCLEGVDNSTQPVLAPVPQLQPEWQPALLGGMMALRGHAADGSGFQAIPYFAWDNRPAAESAQDWMAIWLKQDGNHALRHTLDGEDRAGWEHALYRALPEDA
jgi:DUF1680 family protein